ncbi:PDR/VanB family oxidoreductase [Methylobacterium sp. Leaf93]|uniref:PDR/VanB family oxidoreductase n=1 Tax=Methylobacterium sp. Leaf93 TaxID=1736249 RepID=UPI0006FB0CC9|nr:PDR/VanB family oxidoreductase [Methylobacterium sp. Leaf93]KQP05553.1 ferredoxin [Methylobacterium sp. Leaf93]
MSARLVMKLQVAAAVATTPDVLHLTLVHPRRPELPAWTAGAHVDLRLPDGRVRQYSLCGDPADRGRYEIAIKREDAGRGGSAWVHGNLTVGAVADVSAPRNNFPLAPDAQRHILVAGGIGVTPLLAMARTLAAEAADFALHVCARSHADAPLLADVRAICGDRLQVWFADEGRRLDPTRLCDFAGDTHVYACGPRRLTDAVQSALDAQGWPLEQVHVEHFAPLSDEAFKPEPFEARIASTGTLLHVPADRSLLDVLREHGVSQPASCELGVCGACECGYRDGTVIHRDAVLSVGKRQDRMTPCVSRARGSVTLDL